MSKRKHKHEEHEEHVDESWLVPYSDLLTLLMALFLVLFAMSSVDAGKFQQMAIAMNEEFAGGTGNEEFLSTLDAQTQKDLVEAAAEAAAKEALAEKNLDEKEMTELEKLKEQIDAYIASKNLNLNLKTELTESGLLITIMEHALFDSGSAEVKTEAYSLIKEISTFINTKPPRDIMIMGHTDNVPMHSEKYASNWELSTSRATNFLKIVLANNNTLDARKFSASGYGEFRPVSANDTVEGKAKNRRVEVMVLPLSTEELKTLYQQEFNEMLNETETETKTETKVETEPKQETKKSGH